jgi:hypothetical protein
MANGFKTGGRQPGSPNKATKEFRETVGRVLTENSENVGLWLTRVADGEGDVKPDPGKALDLLAKLAEYAAPKLARTEVTGEDGGPMKVTFGWTKDE